MPLPAPAESAAARFSASDWSELYECWRQDSARQPRVLAWQARRELGLQLHGYPADVRVCSGGQPCGTPARTE